MGRSAMNRRLLVDRVRRGVLQAELGGRDRLPLAGRAELLPVARGTFRCGIETVIEPELREAELQIVDVHPRGEPLAAARAERPRPLFPGLLIELHAELRRPLEDVKKLSKRQEEQ